MDEKLYNQLVKKFKDEFTVTEYNSHKTWVLEHFRRIATSYQFLKVDSPVKHTIDGCTRISTMDEFVINIGMDSFIGVDTGFGCVWYYECLCPNKEEISRFDGHCLVIS
jgi:hypothetical protein